MKLKTKITALVGANLAILTNAISLVGTTAVTSGLGFIYWWVAAWQFKAAEVGVASAAITMMNLLGTFAVLGLGTLLMGEIPRQRNLKRPVGGLITTALLVSTMVGCLLGFAAAFLARFISPDLQPLSDNLQNILLFTVGVGITSFTLVLDQVLLGMLKGTLQMGRNSIFAATKLAALLVVGIVLNRKTGMNIYGTWFLGNLLSVACLALFAMMQGNKLRFYRPDWHLLRHLSRTALFHHILNLALQASSLIMPLIVTAILSVTSNAHFYLAWMVAGFVFVGPLALSTMLYAVGASDPAQLAKKMHFTMKLAFLIGLASNMVIWAGADIVLGLVGAAYRDEASWCLRLLGLSVFPLIIKDHYVAVSRVEGQSGVAMAATWAILGSILELVLAAVGAIMFGLTGVALGWLLAVVVEAVVMVKTVITALRYNAPLVVMPVPEPSITGGQ